MENKKGRFTGIVKRWDPVRGYGFLSMLKKDRYQAQDSLIFIHRNEIKEEYKDLHEQQVVHFDLYENHINANKVTFKAKELKQIRSGSDYISVFGRGAEF